MNTLRPRAPAAGPVPVTSAPAPHAGAYGAVGTARARRRGALIGRRHWPQADAAGGLHADARAPDMKTWMFEAPVHGAGQEPCRLLRPAKCGQSAYRAVAGRMPLPPTGARCPTPRHPRSRQAIVGTALSDDPATQRWDPGTHAVVATWADDLRARQRYRTVAEGWGQADIEEADQFNAANPGHDQWHFVDLPLGAAGYPATDPRPATRT